ncbi:hypothetical protein ACIQF6_31230 [Kitasatospora sp. NPDC092948]|uniref:hypothetical protein n=1 Tax=Kitasatospora sp. NPDC092948 TaxID=3364088 RepID=UPI0038274487
MVARGDLQATPAAVQIRGFALGGALLTALSPRGVLLTGAGLYLLTAAAARFGLAARPPRPAGGASIAETWRTNARLWSSRPRRPVYLALWVSNGLVVGCESLYVPYAPKDAGPLFAAGAVGMPAGDVAVGRFLPRARQARLGVPLCLPLAAPFLLFALHPGLRVLLAAVAVAAVGYSTGLIFQDRLMALTPDELGGHAFGLHGSGMLAMQGVGAALAGAVAERTSPATAITALAVASLAVTLLPAPRLGTPVALE